MLKKFIVSMLLLLVLNFHTYSQSAEDTSPITDEATGLVQEEPIQEEPVQEELVQETTVDPTSITSLSPINLEEIDHSAIKNIYISFDDKDISEEEMIYRSSRNLIYIYDYRYKKAVNTKKLGLGIFSGSVASTITFGLLAYFSMTAIEDDKLSYGLSIPFTALSAIFGIGGMVPGAIMWGVGSVRELNLVRSYYDYPYTIQFLELFSDEYSKKYR